MVVEGFLGKLCVLAVATALDITSAAASGNTGFKPVGTSGEVWVALLRGLEWTKKTLSAACLRCAKILGRLSLTWYLIICPRFPA
jgi:hypothetical protein